MVNLSEWHRDYKLRKALGDKINPYLKCSLCGGPIVVYREDLVKLVCGKCGKRILAIKGE